MTDKICSCGGCHDAVERATQFVCKMIDDDECGVFAFAVASAFMAIRDNFASSLCQQEADEKGLIQALLVADSFGKLAEDIQRTYAKGGYFRLVNDHIQKQRARTKEVQNLPKGD